MKGVISSSFYLLKYTRDHCRSAAVCCALVHVWPQIFIFLSSQFWEEILSAKSFERLGTVMIKVGVRR